MLIRLIVQIPDKIPASRKRPPFQAQPEVSRSRIPYRLPLLKMLVFVRRLLAHVKNKVPGFRNC
jgi:hypothetical protein